jgi:sulfotransferase
MKQVHMISGLPRSGSTLLAAILRQNPNFRAGMSSPVASLCGALVQKMGRSSEFGALISDDQRMSILRGVFQNYHGDTSTTKVVFDTNRGWTSLMPLISTIFPNAKVICCVREVSWILDSIERMLIQNSLQPNRIFGNSVGGTVYTRAEKLMNFEGGLIGLPWTSLREAWFGPFSDNLLVVDYKVLTSDPQKCLDQIYAFIGEEPFKHSFTGLHYEADAYDADLGVVGMHRVRPTVQWVQRETCLPPDLFKKYAHANFWTDGKLNPKKVQIVTP